MVEKKLRYWHLLHKIVGQYNAKLGEKIPGGRPLAISCGDDSIALSYGGTDVLVALAGPSDKRDKNTLAKLMITELGKLALCGIKY